MYRDTTKIWFPLILVCGMIACTVPIASGTARQIKGFRTSYWNASIENCSSGRTMNDCDNDVRSLVSVLGAAYENALAHDTTNIPSQDADLILEDASIRLSSRIVYEMTEGSCRELDDLPDVGASQVCNLSDESTELRNLTDMLSYAAARLENLSQSSSRENETKDQHAFTARLKSMEYLYRMVFAVAKAFLDRPQGNIYIKAAQLQLRLARKYLEMEHNHCACDFPGYFDRLSKLNQIDEGLKKRA